MIEFVVCYLILGATIAGAYLLSPGWNEVPEVEGYTRWDWLGMFFTGVFIWPLLLYWELDNS